MPTDPTATAPNGDQDRIPTTAATLPSCPTHAVCPTCREGWGHYTAGVGYSPTIESERVRRAYLFPEWLTGFPPYDVAGITPDSARTVRRD